MRSEMEIDLWNTLSTAFGRRFRCSLLQHPNLPPKDALELSTNVKLADLPTKLLTKLRTKFDYSTALLNCLLNGGCLL